MRRVGGLILSSNRKYVNRVEDFKIDGEWVNCYSPEVGVSHRTNLGRYWTDMNSRCKVGSEKQLNNKAYIGVTCAFSSFKEFADWASTQIGFNMGHHLDKDLLIQGNKVYSKETCLFIPKEINLIVTKTNKNRELPTGVYFHKASGKYMSRVNRKYNFDDVQWKLFCSVVDAEHWYRENKKEYLLFLANSFKEKMEQRAYFAILNYAKEENFD